MNIESNNKSKSNNVVHSAGLDTNEKKPKAEKAEEPVDPVQQTIRDAEAKRLQDEQ